MSVQPLNSQEGLRLRFSDINDIEKIHNLLSSDNKRKHDPEDQIWQRIPSYFQRAIAEGSVALLEAGDKSILSLTFALRHFSIANGKPEYTEFASSLSLLPGFQSSALLISALVLKEWKTNPPSRFIAAAIKPDNIASLKIYRDRMQWKPVMDTYDITELYKFSWSSCPDPSTGKGFTDLSKDMVDGWDWYACGQDELKFQNNILSNFINIGGLKNRKSCKFIPVDFSNLAF